MAEMLECTGSRARLKEDQSGKAFGKDLMGRKRITLGDVAVMMNLIQKRGRKRAA
ncbi:hypothetical protein AAC387_Pa02g3724 [Persea americana]